MTFKIRKLIPVLFVPAIIAAGFFAGMMLKFSVELHRGNGPGLIESHPVLADRGILFVSSYLMIFGTVVIVLLFIYRWKYYLQTERGDSNNKMWCRQRSDVIGAVEHLQHAYIEVEQHYVAKSRFLNRMSHDLRTPMNAIMGYSMLMERVADDPDKVNYYARRIYTSGQSLLELINDVLDMSCIENGKIKLLENEFSLLGALEEIKTSIKPQIESKNQKFHYYLTNSTETDRIVGDKQRLSQIIRNILSNATKYTPEGGSVDMIVNIIKAAGGRPQMLCQIKDTGCGMSRKFQQKIFTPFEREESSENFGIQGSGLGMCIAKSFTELMDGTIAVDSEVDRGTLVSIMIPLTPVEPASAAAGHYFSGSDAVQGLKFLAAEDNESNAEILYEVLKAMGAECTLTENGQAAVEAFEESAPGQYDAVLMDIQMPVMNGYQAAAAIRRSSHPDAHDIKIIAMTADAFEEDVQRAFISGMDAHVAKPLELEAFINTVASLDLKNKKITGVI